MYIIIISIIIFLAFIIYFIISYNLKEGFDIMALPDDWSLNIPALYADNSDKPWSMIPVAYNNTKVMDVPKQVSSEEQDTITIIAKYPLIKKVLNSMKIDIEKEKYNKKDIPHEDLIMFNSRTWKNPLQNFLSFYRESKFPTLKGCVPNLQKALNNFLKQFNKKYNSDPSEKLIPNYFGKKQFDVMKYQLLSIDENKKNKKDQIFKVIAVIFRQNAIESIYLYLELFKDGSIVEWSIIGYQANDKLLTFRGRNPLDNNFYETKWLYEKGSQVGNPIFTDDDFETYYNNHYYGKANRMEHNYTCFNAEPEFFKLTRGTEQNIIIPQYNKYECESNYSVVGQKKVRGFWDRRCVSDDECPYTNANKNYTNKRGRCQLETGYCELPEGMQNFGYRKYIDPKKYSEYKPLCYNCKSKDSWDPLTKLGQCCEEQKDRNKYPFLKSPDYAFSLDIHDRMAYDDKMKYESNFKKFLANN